MKKFFTLLKKGAIWSLNMVRRIGWTTKVLYAMLLSVAGLAVIAVIVLVIYLANSALTSKTIPTSGRIDNTTPAVVGTAMAPVVMVPVNSKMAVSATKE